jgi:DNA polymerase-3 subunit gamma/tau
LIILVGADTYYFLSLKSCKNRNLSMRIFHRIKRNWKTSTARIFAKAVNCLNRKESNPCNDALFVRQSQGHFLDLIEIDAASIEV